MEATEKPRKRRSTKLTLVSATAVLVLAAAAIAGCNTPAPSEPEPQSSGEQQAPLASTYQDWITYYPDEYNSFAVDQWEEDGMNHSHSYLETFLKEYDPATYNFATPPKTVGCLSCKSTIFEELYDEYGQEALMMPWEEVEDRLDTYFECEFCHTDSQSLELSPNSTYFLETSHDTFSHNDIKTLVCGQCHNQLAMYRGVYAKPGNTFDSINPYRYGTDADALYQAAIEDGAAVMPEEATGAQLVMSSGENELEVFEGSNHQAQGLTCVDCHMTTATNSEGEEYINHNSSGSPLENEVALQKCLTCHNYDTTEEMVDMVRAKQEETADTQARLEGKVATLKELLTEATASGTADETILKEARENYSRANFYVQYYPGWLTKDGAKVVHNPDAFESYLSRAEYLLDESIAQLS